MDSEVKVKRCDVAKVEGLRGKDEGCIARDMELRFIRLSASRGV